MPAKVVAQRYELGKILGEGGMGIVYQGIDTRTNGPVAIKTLKNASDPETLAMFRKEWGELVQLVHPNIVGVRDVGEYEENGEPVPFFVMPLLQGCTLAALIKTGSPRLTVEGVIEIICQVSRGLNAAHEKGLIHRDLKPSNIFVMEDGTAQLIDFGLVHSSNAKTDTGFKGTWQYMSPEQTEAKKVARTSDIFSLGVVAYEALTGKQPFNRGNVRDTTDAVRYYSPQPISEVNPRVPDLVSKAIHVAMAKQPSHRYSSAREFAETLQKAIHNQPIERFDPARIQPKIARARAAFERGDCDFASELLLELEAEGNVDPQITLLRAQVEESSKQKRIRNLFEAVQTRWEQNEIPRAIAKLAEILEIDPGNAQALSMTKSIEKQRNEQQISGWTKLAREHMEGNDFEKARQALDKVFEIQYDEPEALRLRSAIEVREKDAAKAKGEKDRLYSAALKASECGEISSAISTLEKLLDLNRGVPGAATPERDKLYLLFYNNMVSERDAVDNAYAEGTRYLNEKSFDKALEVCDRLLAKYPANAQFKALRIRIQDAQGLFLSAYIADVNKAVEREPSLDRRVGLLEEACNRFPNEQQFVRQLRLAREHRDLVSSILAKARSYEEQEQFGEAIQQWKILASTHPQYVGIESEISQLEGRRERQTNEEKKSRWVQRIDQALDNWSFAEALRLAAEALYDFPDDAEIKSQEKLAKHGLDRILNAERFFEEAKALHAAGKLDETLERLKSALKEDERHFGARSMMINVLGEEAQASVDSDIGRAESLAQAARVLDPEHPSVKRISAVISEKRRAETVAAYISRARELQSSDVDAAIAIIEKGLAEYPGEPRLLQYRSNLTSPAKGKKANPGVSDNDRTRVYEPPMVEERSIGLDKTIGPNGERRPLVEEQRTEPQWQERTEPAKAADPVRPITGPSKTPKARPSVSAGAFIAGIKGSPRRLWTVGGIGLGIVAAVVGAMLFLRSPSGPVAKKPVAKLVDVQVTTDPADAELRVDNVLYPERKLSLRNDESHPVTVSHIGFKTFEATKSTNDNWNFPLTPEPIRLSLKTNVPEGTVNLDERKIGDLDQGSFSDSSIVPDGGKHVLSVTTEAGELFHVAFQGVAGKRPAVDPLDTPDLEVTSSLGSLATVYSGAPAKVTLPDGQSPGKADKNGLDVDLSGIDISTPQSDVAVKVAKGKHMDAVPVPRGNAPALNIISSTELSQGGSVSIAAQGQNVELLVDGRKKTAAQPGVWHLKEPVGDHQFKVVAPGMHDQDFILRVTKGSNQSRKVVMEAAPLLSTLVIKGGTPGARVFLDHGQLIGVLDAAGALTYDKVTPGDHEITMAAEGYGPLTYRQSFAGGKTVPLGGELKLSKATGSVTITVSPASAKVEFSQAGKNDWHAATLPNVSLPPGSYDFAATAPNFKRSQKAIIVDAGRVGNLNFVLVAEGPVVVPPTSLVQGLKEENGWYFEANAWVPIQTALQKYTILFLRPDKYTGARHRPKHLEWELSLGADRISYSVDSHGLNRKAKIDKETEPMTKAVGPTDDLVYSFTVVLDAHGVQVRSRDGSVLDEVKSDGKDWTKAKLSVKGDAYFDVRR